MIKSAREVVRSLMGNPISALSNNQQHSNTATQQDKRCRQLVSESMKV